MFTKKVFTSIATIAALVAVGFLEWHAKYGAGSGYVVDTRVDWSFQNEVVDARRAGTEGAHPLGFEREVNSAVADQRLQQRIDQGAHPPLGK